MPHPDETRGLLANELNNFSANIAAATHAAASKATPVDADELPLSDSAAAFGLKKLTWANLKTTLLAAFFGTNARFCSNQVYLPGAGGTVTLDTGYASGFVGTLSVSATRLTFTPQSRRTVYAIACYGTTMTLTQLHNQDGSGGGATFTVTVTAAGIININNTSGQDMQVNVSFSGNLSAG